MSVEWENNYGNLKTKFTEGDWCIGIRPGNHYHQMYHYHGAHHMALYTRSHGKNGIRGQGRWACSDCRKVPSDELIAMYVMLEFDHAGGRIASCQ